jgi:hypothetical protein
MPTFGETTDSYITVFNIIWISENNFWINFSIKGHGINIVCHTNRIFSIIWGNGFLGMQTIRQIWEKSLIPPIFSIYGATRFEASPIY